MILDVIIKNIYLNLPRGDLEKLSMIGARIKHLIQDIQHYQYQIETLQQNEALNNKEVIKSNGQETQKQNINQMLQQLNDQLEILKKEFEDIYSKVKQALQQNLTKSQEFLETLNQERLDINLQQLICQQTINSLTASQDDLKNTSQKLNQQLEQQKQCQWMDQVYLNNLLFNKQQYENKKAEKQGLLQKFNDERQLIIKQQQELEESLNRLKLQKQEMLNINQVELKIDHQDLNQQSQYSSRKRDLERKKGELKKQFEELQNQLANNEKKLENINYQSGTIDEEIITLNQQSKQNDERLANLSHDQDNQSSKLKDLNNDLEMQEKSLKFIDDQIQNTKKQQFDKDIQIIRLQKEAQLLNKQKFEIEKQLSDKERHLEKLIYEEERLGSWDDLIKEQKSQQEEIKKLINQKQLEEEELKIILSHVRQYGKYETEQIINVLNKQIHERTELLNQVSIKIQGKEQKQTKLKEQQKQDNQDILFFQAKIFSLNESINQIESQVYDLEENQINLKQNNQQFQDNHLQIYNKIQSLQKDIQKQQNYSVQIEQQYSKIQDYVNQIKIQIQHKVDKQNNILEKKSQIISEIQVQQRDIQTKKSEIKKTKKDIKLIEIEQNKEKSKQQQVEQDQQKINSQIEEIEREINQLKQSYIIFIDRKIRIDKNIYEQNQQVSQIDKLITERMADDEQINHDQSNCEKQIQQRESLIIQIDNQLNSLKPQIIQVDQNLKLQDEKYQNILLNIKKNNENISKIQQLQQHIEQKQMTQKQIQIDSFIQLKDK